MKSKKVWVGTILVAVLLVFYVSSLKVQLNEAAAAQENYKNEIKNLSALEEGEASEANKAFIKRFFNYTNTKARNDEIKPYMTSRAFQSVQPEAVAIVSEGDSKGSEVKTAASNLKGYERIISKTEAEYINEFDLSIGYNGVNNTESVLIKTKLIYVENKGWLVDSIAFINQPSGI